MDTLEVKLEKLVGCINARNKEEVNSLNTRYVNAMMQLYALSDRVNTIIRIGMLVDKITADYGDCSYKHDGDRSTDSLVFDEISDGNNFHYYQGILLGIDDDDFIGFDGQQIYGDIDDTNASEICPIDYKDLHPTRVFTSEIDNKRSFVKLVDALEKFVVVFPTFEKDVRNDAAKLIDEYSGEFKI